MPDSTEERAAILRWEAILGVVLIIVMLGAASIGFVLIDRETDARIREQQRLRGEVVRGLEIVLIDQCREIERLKAGERRDAERRYRDLPRNLALLGIEFTPELLRVARQERERELRRFRAKPGGCGEYPPPIG